MPIGAPATYPSVEDVMNLARSYVNDTMPGINGVPGEGQILTDNSTRSPFTIPFVNAAIRELYREMGNSGAPSLIQDNLIVSGLTPVNGPLGLAIPDPSVQVSLTFTGYFDGSTTNAGLKLPSNCLAVLKCWERQTGSNLDFSEMTQAQFGLESRNQTTVFGDFEYRSDGIYMVGCLLTNDLRMRLLVQLPGQVSGDGSDFSTLQIPIQDSTDALALKVAAKYSIARGSDQVPALQQMAQDATRQLINRQVRAKQSINYQRQAYGENNSWGWGYGW